MKTLSSRPIILFVAGIVALARLTVAQEVSTVPSNDPLQIELDAKVTALQEEAKAREAEFKRRGEDLTKEASAKFSLDITVDWKDHEMSLDLPTVTMATKQMSMDVPQVAMRTKRIVFDTPSVRMVNKKVGQYPEFHGFTVRWSDIITSVPETFMERQEIKMDFPEFTWGRTDWSMDIPQVKMETTRFVLKLPEITVKQAQFIIPINNSDVEKKASDLKTDAEKFGAEMRAKGNALGVEYQQKFMARGVAEANAAMTMSNKTFSDKKTEIEKKYDPDITAIDQSLAQGQGKLTPADVKILTDKRAVVVEKKTAALAPVLEEQLRLETSQTQLKTIGKVGGDNAEMPPGSPAASDAPAK